MYRLYQLRDDVSRHDYHRGKVIREEDEDGKIINKIEDLKEDPLKRGKQLKGNLSELRSIRAAGQRYRIIYKVVNDELIVIVVAVGIRKDGDKKDIYNLMKKYIKLGLLDE